MKKKYKAENLWDNLIPFCTIACSSCGKQDEIYGTEDEACDRFFDKGWRATEQNTYCPECAKKKLKNP